MQKAKTLSIDFSVTVSMLFLRSLNARLYRYSPLPGLPPSLQIASAAVLTGVDARNTFEDYLSQFGGTFIDFDDLEGGGLANELTASHGVTFATIENRVRQSHHSHQRLCLGHQSRHWPPRAGRGYPVHCCTDDGRYPYEIAFTQPQRWAGVERKWDSTTITRFFDPSDTLLAELTGSMFIGFVAETESTEAWVQRIMIDGVGPSGELQVGYTDDLFFGTAAVPEPADAAWLLGLIAILALRTYKRTLR